MSSIFLGASAVPKETKPRSGWRRKGIDFVFDLVPFAQLDLESIENALGMSLAADDRRFLQDRARLYRLALHNVDGGPRAERRAALKELIASPNPAEILHQLDDATRDLIAEAADEDHRPLPSDPPRHGFLSCSHLPLGRLRLKLAHEYPEPLRSETIKAWAQCALAKLPFDKGRRRTFARRLLIESLAAIYFRQTGRPPGRSYNSYAKGRKDTGPFVEFVHAVLGPIDRGAAGMSGLSGVIRSVLTDFRMPHEQGDFSP
jgi:hypothetical protein